MESSSVKDRRSNHWAMLPTVQHSAPFIFEADWQNAFALYVLCVADCYVSTVHESCGLVVIRCASVWNACWHGESVCLLLLEYNR